MITSTALKQFISKNGLFLLLMAGALTLVINPDAKAWFLQQLLRSGVFNAKISEEAPQQAIDFTYRDENDQVKHIASLKGKVVLLNFWASWCPPCRAEFPSLQHFYDTVKDDPHIVVLTFNEDDSEAAAQAYLQKEGYTVPYFKALPGVPDAVYTGTLPTTVILDKDGRIRYHHEGLARYDAADFLKQIQQLANQ